MRYQLKGYSEKKKITHIDEIGEDTRLFTLEGGFDAKPGQFVMAWLPELSEKPVSFMAGDPNRETKLAIKKVPEHKVESERPFSHEVFKLRKGDSMYLRGPYGNSFMDFPPKNYYNGAHNTAFLVAGGVGAAPLSFLSEELSTFDYLGVEVSFLLGARNKAEAEGWQEQLNLPISVKDNLFISTDDGTFGKKGVVTDLFDDIGDVTEDSSFYICGPEVVLQQASERAANYVPEDNIILSAERYMKCGDGICGGCGITGSDGVGYLVCRDGPVFTYAQLKGGDLGKYRRLKSGLRIPIQD